MIQGKRWYFTRVPKFIRSVSSHPSSVRVRFAPSPTGNLHVGGLRTALYNYLFAKSRNGVFILRIEDTDQKRYVPGTVQSLEDDLRWAGVESDEGPSKGGDYGPYFQSERLDLYKREVKKLIENNHAYYCFCTEKRLDLLRRDALRRRERPKYDNRCRNLNSDEVEEKLTGRTSYCIRFKLTPFLEPFNDLVYGPILNNIAEVEGDPVIIKNDGYPTYHFANVVDDHYMQISHVLRGVEWQPSTTKHLLLFKAFNWTPPEYAHIPLLLNEDGKKLSKRHGDLSVNAFRKQYVYPKALTNLLILCGGGFVSKENPDISKELKNIDELSDKFSLKALNVNCCQLPLSRLKDYNRLELKRLAANDHTLNDIVHNAKELLLSTFPESKNNISDEKIKQVLLWSIDNGRLSNINELTGAQFSFLWRQPVDFDTKQYDTKFFDVLPELIKYYEGEVSFNQLEISNYLKTFTIKNELPFAKFMRFLRACLSGLKDGPSIAEMFIHLGKAETLRRLEKARKLGAPKNSGEAATCN